MKEATDRELRCEDCGERFMFTVDEQHFFADKGFEKPPKRCVECRRSRRLRREAEPTKQTGR
jgi:DNA-directed RNA polymerase subunit RPC12/RpoP